MSVANQAESNPTAQTIKDDIIRRLHENAAAIATLGDSLFYFGELGMQESRSAGLLTGVLEQHGFQVTRGISGFPTGFVASYGQGSPVIALHSEYDALPAASQQSGVAAHREIVPGAPGHSEGHNVNAAVLIAAALAVRYAIEKHALPGSIRVFGAPGEEQLLSRPFYVRDGYFDDVDIAFHDHISDEFRTEYGLSQSASILGTFRFTGETAHAAVAPWRGRDALDAVVLMDAGMAQFREHIKPDTRLHRVIGRGGVQPNIITEEASITWSFRAPNAPDAAALLKAAQRIAQGAALMADVSVRYEPDAAVWPVRCNQVIAETIQRNIERIGMPTWSEEDIIFAKAVQTAIDKPAIGLRETVTPLTGPARQSLSSNDCGDISWVVPMGRVWFPSNIPHASFHHWSAGAALATAIAHKGAVAGAAALATSVLDFLLEPELVKRARQTFAVELDGQAYQPLIPADQRPPTDLHRDVMETYRPLMKPHYLNDEPLFRF